MIGHAGILDIAFEPANDGIGIIVRFKVVPAFFPPSLVEGMSVTLRLLYLGKSIPGKLAAFPPRDAPRGMWFAFRFIADDAADTDAVSFEGRNHWSPITGLEFTHAGATHFIRNPFQRI